MSDCMAPAAVRQLAPALCSPRLIRFLPSARYEFVPLTVTDRLGAPYGDGGLQTHMQGSWTKIRAYLETPEAPSNGSLVVVLDEAAFRAG